MRCETTSPGVQECALCESSVYHVHHASICVNVVVGARDVLCELHVMCVFTSFHFCGAVVGITLGLIAHVVVVVFVVAILHGIFCIGGILFTHPVGDSKLLFAVTEFSL